MANLPESNAWEEGVYQLETSDYLLGGPGGTLNVQPQQLANRTAYLKTIANEVIAARGGSPNLGARVDQITSVLESITGDVGNLQLVTTPILSRAMRLDWLYAQNRVAFELWSGEYTLLDMTAVVVQSGILGDDSVDVASTATLVVGQEYVLFDATNRETIKVTEILTATRFRVESNLAHTYGATAKVARTSFAIANDSASAIAGDTYFSQKINLGSDGVTRAVVVRRQDNAANIRVYYRDAVHAVWTESIWAWRRTADPVPTGYVDVEYPVPVNGDAYLKIVVEGASSEVVHIVGVAAGTQLGGTHNAPTTPVNSSPADNATNLPERPTLALASYSSPVGSALSGSQFQVATAVDGFGSPFVDSGQQPAGLSYQIAAGRLAVNTNYWFRGRVKDAEGEWSAWSAPTKFTTAVSFVYVQAPSNTSPTAGQTEITATPTLTSSAFAVANGSDTHASSQWQIRTAAGSYAAPTYDSGTDASNKVSLVVPDAILAAGTTTYYWRVRHNGTTHGWSEWSTETNFVTKQNFGQVVGLALVTTGGGAGSWQRVDENGAAKTTDAAYFNAHPTYAGVVPQTVDGQAMIKIPAFYYKVGTIASGTYAGKKALWICDQPQPGFVLHPAFKNAGADIAQYWVAKYQAGYDGSSKATSLAGATPLVSIDFPTMQTRCNARNTGGVTGFGMWSIYQLAAIQMLAMIEIGGADSQSLIGQGHVAGSSALATDNATVAQATWRGVVGLWGNVWQMVDGLQTDASSKYKIWDRLGNKTYITTTKTAPANGYPVTMAEDVGADFDLRDIFAAATIDASAGNGTYGDHFRSYPNAVAYHGGRWSDGANAGLFSLLVEPAASSSDTHVGGRLAKV